MQYYAIIWITTPGSEVSSSGCEIVPIIEIIEPGIIDRKIALVHIVSTINYSWMNLVPAKINNFFH